MQLLQNESKPGYYNVYLTESGEKYIVLEGLDANLIHTPGVIESYMQNHYATFEMAYWGMFTVTFVYLIGIFIVLPLYSRWKKGLPLFSDQ